MKKLVASFVASVAGVVALEGLEGSTGPFAPEVAVTYALVAPCAAPEAPAPSLPPARAPAPPAAPIPGFPRSGDAPPRAEPPVPESASLAREPAAAAPEFALLLPATPAAPPPSDPLPPPAYVPPGARDATEAILTLLAPQLDAFAEPDASAPRAAFTLREGDQIRPLSRLRRADSFDWIEFEREGRRWWSPAEYFVRVGFPRALPASPALDLPIGLEPVDRDTALPPDYAPSDLVAIDPAFVLGPRTILLRRDAATALQTMLRAAQHHGLAIRAFSGFRDFPTQKRLYLEAIAAQGPKQNGTAAPGYSEHQLGTTVDLSNLDPQMILNPLFGTTPEGQWLAQHAAEFGFVHSYTNENTKQVGYKPEPWHLRYMGTSGQREPAPLASAAAALAPARRP